MNSETNIKSIESGNTGGGIICDRVTLKNGYVLHIGSDGVSIHKPPTEDTPPEDLGLGELVSHYDFEPSEPYAIEYDYYGAELDAVTLDDRYRPTIKVFSGIDDTHSKHLAINKKSVVSICKWLNSITK